MATSGARLLAHGAELLVAGLHEHARAARERGVVLPQQLHGLLAVQPRHRGRRRLFHGRLERLQLLPAPQIRLHQPKREAARHGWSHRLRNRAELLGRTP